MSGPAAARAAASAASVGGPLNSALGQWALLGLGAYAVAGPDDAGEFLRECLRFALRALEGDSSSSSSRSRAPPRTIVVQAGGAPSDATSSKLYASAVVRLLLSAGFCWGSYAVFTSSSWMPESIASALPVARSLFDKAVFSLAESVTSVRDTLVARISDFSNAQRELGDNLDETKSDVLAARSDLRDLRYDADDAKDVLGRCEASLGRSERRISFAARGVGILVRCARAALLRPPDDFIDSDGDGNGDGNAARSGGGNGGSRLRSSPPSSLVAELDEFERSANPEDAGAGHPKENDCQRGTRTSSVSATPASASPGIPSSWTLRRPSRRLERVDSCPERTDYERRPEQRPRTPREGGNDPVD